MKIINPPEYIEEVNYQNAIDKYLIQLEIIQDDVIAVYQMGSVGTPGLSDIDLIVVVKDDFKPENSTYLSAKAIDNRLFLHDPIIIPKSICSVFPYVFHATSLNILYGVDCIADFSSQSKLEIESLSLCYLIDIISMRLLQFAKTKSTGVFDQRAWATRIWSVTHSYNIMKSIGLSLPSDAEFMLDELFLFRKNWNEKHTFDKRLLLKTYETSLLLFLKIIEQAISTYKSMNGKELNLYFETMKVLSSKDISTPRFICKKHTIFGVSFFVYKCYHNILYSCHLSGYGFLNLTDRLDDNLKEHFNIMKKRRKVIESHKIWLNKHTPNTDSLAGNLGVLQTWKKSYKKNILSILFRTLDKLRK
jgi:hypothetical protein|tara:strand:+ start:2580 stop:3662 length:1083 start_codon:yes stop_codon:yes gene_type:complete